MLAEYNTEFTIRAYPLYGTAHTGLSLVSLRLTEVGPLGRRKLVPLG